MSLSYFGSKENKENQYHHDVQLSPQKGSKNNGVTYNRTNKMDGNQKWIDEEANSPTLFKARKQLVELWLNPVSTLDTSLEHMVDDDLTPAYQCSCPKEHLS